MIVWACLPIPGGFSKEYRRFFEHQTNGLNNKHPSLPKKRRMFVTGKRKGFCRPETRRDEAQAAGVTVRVAMVLVALPWGFMTTH